MKDMTIDLADFFRRLAEKWKLLVCCALIGSVLLGSYGYKNAVQSFTNAQAQHTRYAEAAKDLPGYYSEDLFAARESVGDPKRVAFAEAFAGLYRSFIRQYGGENMFSPDTENLQAYMMFLDSYKDVLSVMSAPERAYFEMLASLNLEDENTGHPIVSDFSGQAPSVFQIKWVGVGFFLGFLAGCFLATVLWKPARKE
ncbi:MAG: hypothetical protein ILP14_07160 [Oscillospiraceae bacterium]|nr:hypothetical protein [Oscillospiraceae bacterium]